MALMGPVLAATDLSDRADEALRQADQLAHHLRGPLHVCHVLPEFVRVRSLFPQLQQQDVIETEALQRNAASVAASRVEARTGRQGSDTRVVIEAGSPHAGILTAAEAIGAGVIVMGPGDVAQRVARAASCAVLVARPSGTGTVLGATDFSDPSLPALEAAAREASRRRVPLCVMHSVDVNVGESLSMPAAFPLPAVPPDVVDGLREDARRQLQACLDRLGAAGETRVGAGPPALEIMKAAAELSAELVVVGTRGRTGLSRLVLGSVAEAILAGAPCSVLVVRLREG
jgi:nucleotide-binding universal stress UspA family protein